VTFSINVGIPNVNNDPNDDCPLIQQNFSNISSFLAVNHVAPGSSGAGKHSVVELIRGAAPATSGNDCFLYGKLATRPALTELFFKDQNNSEAQLTGPFLSATRGYTTLLGGIVIQWGTDNFGAALTGTITVPYTGLSLYTAIAVPNGATKRQISTNVTSATTFTWTVDNTITSLNWITIGTL